MAIAATLTAILWGAIFPGLAVAGAGDSLPLFLFLFVGATIAMWGATVFDVVNRQDVQRAVDELGAKTTVLSELVAACDREAGCRKRPGALAERRADAVRRLTDIGSAADDFSRQIDRPEAADNQADSLE